MWWLSGEKMGLFGVAAAAENRNKMGLFGVASAAVGDFRRWPAAMV